MAKIPPRGVVPCVVSGRWLEFPKKSGGRFNFGEPIEICVKTRGNDGKPRKLCELIVTREDLMRAISQVSLPSKPESNGRY